MKKIDKKIKYIRSLLRDDMFKHDCEELAIGCPQCDFTIMHSYLKQWLDRLLWEKNNPVIKNKKKRTTFSKIKYI